MMKRSAKLLRLLAPAMSAGLLLQAGGCNIDPAAIGSSFVSVIAGGLVQNLVFGLFNVPI